MANIVRDNSVGERYELDAAGTTAFITYRRSAGVVTLLHAEVPQELSGQGLGSQLVRGALELVRAQGAKVVPRCPFIASYMEKHPEFQDLRVDP
jgi:hypothetical protein